jgi:hypothetical protein
MGAGRDAWIQWALSAQSAIGAFPRPVFGSLPGGRPGSVWATRTGNLVPLLAELSQVKVGQGVSARPHVR